MLASELRERNPDAIERIRNYQSVDSNLFFYGIFIDSFIQSPIEIWYEVV